VGQVPQLLKTGYKPRPWQRVMQNQLKRFNVLVLHRRGGKTVFSINEMVDQAMRFNKNDTTTGEDYRDHNYTYIAPTFRELQQTAFHYFM